MKHIMAAIHTAKRALVRVFGNRQRRLLEMRIEQHLMLRRGRRLSCAKDPVMRRFIIQASLDHLTLDEIVAKARTRFGDRAPPRSTIGNFLKRLRDEMREVPR